MNHERKTAPSSVHMGSRRHLHAHRDQPPASLPVPPSLVQTHGTGRWMDEDHVRLQGAQYFNVVSLCLAWRSRPSLRRMHSKGTCTRELSSRIQARPIRLRFVPRWSLRTQPQQVRDAVLDRRELGSIAPCVSLRVAKGVMPQSHFCHICRFRFHFRVLSVADYGDEEEDKKKSGARTNSDPDDEHGIVCRLRWGQKDFDARNILDGHSQESRGLRCVAHVRLYYTSEIGSLRCR